MKSWFHRLRSLFGKAQRDRDLSAELGAHLQAGLCFAIPLAGSLDRFLFSTAAHDISTFTSAIAVLMCAGALACYVPARRAMRVEPVVALRDE